MFTWKKAAATWLLLGLAIAGCTTSAPSPAPSATATTTPVVEPMLATRTPTSSPLTATPSRTPPPTAPQPSPTFLPPSPPPRPSPPPSPDAMAPRFQEDVLPILQARCVKCHAGSQAPRGLQLDSYEHIMKGSAFRAVVVPGKPEESEIVRRIRGISVPRMPFDGPPFLTEEEIATIEEWIAAGARK